MYKLIVIDLDGTLLDSYGQISEENKKQIKNAIQKGIYVVIASGRNPMSVKNIAMEIGSDDYSICGNGSIIYNLKSNKIIYNKNIKKQKVLQVIKICEENSIYYSINTTQSIITKSLNYNVLFYHQENSYKPDDKKTNISIVQDLYKYIEQREQDDYLKINICDNDNIIFNSIIRKLKSIRDIEVLDVAHMSRKIIKNGTQEIPMEYYYTEITSANVDKWYAIEYLAQMLNINNDEIVCIGDNINDLLMIKNAQVGVAMGNSCPDVKNKADIIVSDNNKNGVAEAIQKLIS